MDFLEVFRLASVFRRHSFEDGSIPEDNERFPELIRLIVDGYAFVKEVKIGKGKVVVNEMIQDRLRGSAEHKRLCMLAIRWLIRTTKQQIRVEEGYVAGKFDVATEDRSLCVECGCTSVDKAIQSIEAGVTLAVIPFQKDPVLAFVFSPSPDASVRETLKKRVMARRFELVKGIFKAACEMSKKESK